MCRSSVLPPEGSSSPRIPSGKGPPRPLVAWKVQRHKEACAPSAERREDFRRLTGRGNINILHINCCLSEHCNTRPF